MTRGELAKSAGVNIETLRFYEQKGLIAEPPRSESGYRQYSEDAVARIQFIKSCKDLGFSLKEIKELLALRVDSDNTCDDVRDRAEAKLADTEQKIRELQRIKKSLRTMIVTCNERGSTGDCPILESLEQPIEER